MNPQQQKMLAGSLAEFGDLSGVIYNRKTRHLIGGHQRVAIFKAANPRIESEPFRDKIGTVRVGYFVVDGTRHSYREVSWDEHKERAAMIAANQHGGEFVEAQLVQMLKELQSHFGDSAAALTGFTIEELTALYDQFQVTEPEPEDAAGLIDKAAELQKKWQTASPQVWQIGPHRLLCGDSELPYLHTMGAKADMIWTDPPWNVALGTNPNPRRLDRKIKSDDLGAGFPAFLKHVVHGMAESIKPGGAVYLVMSPQEWGTTDRILKDFQFHWSSTIIWAKDLLVLGRKDYHAQYEPIWYGWADGSKRLVPLKDRKQSDLWSIPRPKRSP